MKKIIVVLTLVSTVLFSCNNNEIEYGTLQATVYLNAEGGAIVNTARMSLASSQVALNKGDLILKDVLTNAAGVITIPDLQPGTYYYECIATKYGGGKYYGTGSCTIRADETTTFPVILTEQ